MFEHKDKKLIIDKKLKESDQKSDSNVNEPNNLKSNRKVIIFVYGNTKNRRDEYNACPKSV
jgi:hypothetical protein